MNVLINEVSIGKQPRICNGTQQILHLAVCASQIDVFVMSHNKICDTVNKRSWPERFRKVILYESNRPKRSASGISSVVLGDGRSSDFWEDVWPDV